MDKTVVTITEHEFYRHYKPQQNHLDNNASFDGVLYETFGEEREYCHELANKENRVWTIIECDEYDPDDPEYDPEDDKEDEACLYIISGFHVVNRIGFIVTEKTYDDNIEIEVKL